MKRSIEATTAVGVQTTNSLSFTTNTRTRAAIAQIPEGEKVTISWEEEDYPEAKNLADYLYRNFGGLPRGTHWESISEADKKAWNRLNALLEMWYTR